MESRMKEPYRQGIANQLAPESCAGGREVTGSRRPYGFGEFDLLAVAIQPSTNRWDTFMYTVADWLLPGRTDPLEMLKFQPVAATPNADWTDSFATVVKWFRS